MNAHNLLIVDDSPHIHKLLKVHLGPDPITIHSAYDAESGLTQADAIQPHLVLMDIDMPGIDGLEACRRLKANPSTAESPVIFLTAICSTNDKVKAFEMGAADYITKPFASEEIRARVKAALKQQVAVRPPAYTDSLTGLWNQAYLDVQLPAQLSLAKRTGRPLSCTVADFDSLQNIYEAYGRPVAEQIIKGICATWSARCRPEDILCHLGGGRLVLLQPATHHGEAMSSAQIAHAAISRQLTQADYDRAQITCSFGVSESDRQWSGSLIESAESAAFDARLAGGNRVVASAISSGLALV